MCVLTAGGGWTQTEGGEVVREALQLVTNPVFLETCIRCLCMHPTECPSTPQLWGEAFIQVNTWWCTHSSQGVWSSTWCPVCLLAPVIRDHITCNAASASPYMRQGLEWISMVSCWLEISGSACVSACAQQGWRDQRKRHCWLNSSLQSVSLVCQPLPINITATAWEQ